MSVDSVEKEVVLKVRVPISLMQRINDYRHAHKFDSKKDAVVTLLLAALADQTNLPSPSNTNSVAAVTDGGSNA